MVKKKAKSTGHIQSSGFLITINFFFSLEKRQIIFKQVKQQGALFYQNSFRFVQDNHWNNTQIAFRGVHSDI